MTEDIKCGIYRHYKGFLYQVLGIAHDANATPNRTVVVYIGLELVAAHLGPRMAVRTLEDFTAMVWGTGSTQRVSRRVPRFTYLGSELTQEMIEND